MKTPTKKPTEKDDGDFATMEMVKIKSERATSEAFSVLDGIKEGKISLAEAIEMNNSIGKVNGALGNIIKSEIVCLALGKQARDYAAKRLAAEVAI